MTATRSGRPMLLIERMTDGGAQVLVGTQAAGLAARGWDPIVCCWGEGGASLRSLSARGIDARCLDLRRRSLASPLGFARDVRRVVAEVSRMVRSEGVVLLHSHMHESNFIASAVTTLTGCPAIFTVHNVRMTPLARPDGSARSRLRRLAIRWTSSRARAIVAVGNQVAASLSDLRIDRNKIVVIPNGIPVPAVNGSTRARTRGRLGLPDDTPVLACVARLVPQKRHADLIRALPMVVSRQPAARLILLGQGPEEAALRSLAAKCGVERHIEWMGHRNDAIEMMAGADLFVLPSAYEGIPVALLEAMAIGLPVVVTDVPGTSEVVENGVSGLRVPAADPAGLAEGILRILDDREEAVGLAREAARRVRESFSAEAMIDGVDALYRRVLGAGHAS